MNRADAHVREKLWAEKLAKKIGEQVLRGAGKGLDAARMFLIARIKETLSVPAPRKAVRLPPGPGSKRGAIRYYRATTRALPGAPPRKLSGRLRASVTSEKVLAGTVAIWIGANARAMPSRRHPMGFSYPRYHELQVAGMSGSGKHPFIRPTVEKYRRELVAIVGSQIRLHWKGR